jgi:hypothetical protein
MRSSDVIRSIVIIICFLIIYSFIVVSDTVVDMSSEWSKYRCNPMFMPFASLFGYSSMENFKYCNTTNTNKDMPDLLAPSDNNINLLGNIGGGLTTDIQSSRKFLGNFRTNITSTFGSIYGLIMGVVFEFYRMTLAIKDMLGKTAGVTRTLVYTLEGSITTMESANNTTFMKALRKISKMKIPKMKGCFSGDTLIKLKSGEYKRIDEIEVNDTLTYDTRVLATMKITNVMKETDELVSTVYMIPGGCKSQDILVTGSHLIYDNITKEFMLVRRYRNSIKTNRRIETVYCLITDNHTIPIGKYIFHDWEDTPNKSKDII